MRQKTILLGLLFVASLFVLMSARVLTDNVDYGFDLGENMPSIMVDGKDLTAEFSDEPEAILVVWSVGDATSRVVHSWITNHRGRVSDIPVYSICLDADQQEAEYLALLDNAYLGLEELWGARSGSGKSGKVLRELASKGSAMIYQTTYGKIQSVEPASMLWQRIQREALT